MSNGKGKGSQWERDVAKFLTYWLTGQSKEYYFWRSPGSGSIATVTGTNPSLHGDIVPLKPDAEFFCNLFLCECKAGYKETSLDQLLKYNKGYKIQNFWEQCVNDANESKKFPLLLFKKHRFKTPWIGITSEVVEKLYKYTKGLRFVHLCWGKDLPDTFFFEYKEFFNVISPSIMKENLMEV